MTEAEKVALLLEWLTSHYEWEVVEYFVIEGDPTNDLDPVVLAKVRTTWHTRDGEPEREFGVLGRRFSVTTFHLPTYDKLAAGWKAAG